MCQGNGTIQKKTSFLRISRGLFPHLFAKWEYMVAVCIGSGKVEGMGGVSCEYPVE